MEGCYWIYIPDKMARRDCDKSIFYLPPHRIKGLEPEEMLEPFVGERCPNCGKTIIIKENSYDLIKPTHS